MNAIARDLGTHRGEPLHVTDEHIEVPAEYSNLLKTLYLCSFLIFVALSLQE